MSNILDTAFKNLSYDFKSIKTYTFSLAIDDIKREMKKENTWLAEERKKGILGELFSKLDEITKDCLYWYEVEENSIAKQMVSDLNQFREINKVYKDDKEKHRNLSGKGKARTNEVMNSSKILYVGTVEGKVRKSDGLTTISSRTFQHLGFYDKGSTGALHLWYWANYSLKLHVIELPKALSPYRNVLEKLLAVELKPLIGSHR